MKHASIFVVETFTGWQVRVDGEQGLSGVVRCPSKRKARRTARRLQRELEQLGWTIRTVDHP